MKLRKSNKNDQNQYNNEIKRRSPSEVDPLSNDEIPDTPDEYFMEIDPDQDPDEDDTSDY